MSTELSEIRREQILEAATKVFASQGFSDARMDDIVEVAGLSKGAVYWYFKSKEDIILTILERFLGRGLDQLERFLETDQSARARLLAIASRFASEVEDILPIMPIAYEFYALATREEKIRRSFKDYFDKYQDLFETLIRQGIEKQEFKEVDPQMVAIELIGLLEGLTLLWTVDIVEIKKNRLGGLFESGFALILDGMRSDQGEYP